MFIRSPFHHRQFTVTRLVALCALLLIATLAAFKASAPHSHAAAQQLSFEDRVAAQRAIEEVYYRHRLWPTDNPQPKPPLDALIGEDALRGQSAKVVEDALRLSTALARYWQRPVSAADLQAEVDRMARDTRQPDVLRELWAALGNDPLRVAECLSRPTLVERALREGYASDERFHGDLRRRAEADQQSGQPGADTAQAASKEAVTAVPEPTKEKMTYEELKRFIVGQKVIILKTDPKQDNRGFHRYGKSFKARGEAERITSYVGRTGVVVELITEKDGTLSWDGYVIALDGSDEKVVARNNQIGFLAEMEVAKTYVGKSLWSGGVSLVKDYAPGMPPDQVKANSFNIPDGQRLVVTRAEWGESKRPIVLCFKTPQGEEGCFNGNGHIFEKFGPSLYVTVLADRDINGFYFEDFYFDDPLKEPPAVPAQSAEQLATNLVRLKGEWEMNAAYSVGGLSISGGGALLTLGRSYVTGKRVIEQPAPDVVTFKLSSDPKDYVIALKYDQARKQYILSAKRGDDLEIDGVALVYQDKEGFVKAGPSKGGRRSFSPKISVADTGDHTWLIRPDFTIEFTKVKK